MFPDVVVPEKQILSHLIEKDMYLDYRISQFRVRNSSILSVSEINIVEAV